MIKDITRQSLNLVLGSIMWLCSSLNLVFDGARSPADMSDTNDSLLWRGLFDLAADFCSVFYLRRAASPAAQ